MKFDTRDIILITNNEYCRTHKTIFTFLQYNNNVFTVCYKKMSTNKARELVGCYAPSKIKKGDHMDGYPDPL